MIHTLKEKAVSKDGKQSLHATLLRMIRAAATSRLNYRLSYAVDLACPLVLGYWAIAALTDPLVLLACFCAGAFVFSFVEYAMHRWFFHAATGVATPMHRAHHSSPREPTALPCISSAVVALVLRWPISAVGSDPIADSFLCGLLAAYFLYAVLHHLQHGVRIKDVPWRWLQRRWLDHAVHHGRLDRNFGVTTSIWDRVFGTHLRSRRLGPPGRRRGNSVCGNGVDAGVRA